METLFHLNEYNINEDVQYNNRFLDLGDFSFDLLDQLDMGSDLESSDGGERLTALGHLCVKVNKSCHQTCALTWRICRTAYRHKFYDEHQLKPYIEKCLGKKMISAPVSL